ncbi:MAG: HAD family hydrolase [Sulfuritalea sp.]|nr:HAD family hydrolase [Sulfuritalea sp.]
MQSSSQPCAGVIFDFEGTLVDFQWRLAPAEAELRRAFGQLGFCGPEFSHGNYATLWNAAVALWAPQGRLDDLRRALGPIYDRWDADALTRWTLRPGAVALLERLAARGLRVGLVSNIGRRALGAALQRFGCAPLLSPIVSRDDVSCMKPRAEGILRVASEWRQTPGTLLFVGDSRADVFAARAAGLPVAIIRGGECAEADFADALPDHFISGLDEIAALAAGR